MTYTRLQRFEILEYLTLAELDQWLEFVTEEFPDVTYLKQIGTTVEDRPIMGFHLGDKNDNSDKKKIYMGKLIIGDKMYNQAVIIMNVDEYFVTNICHQSKTSILFQIVVFMQENGFRKQHAGISSMKFCKLMLTQTMK